MSVLHGAVLLGSTVAALWWIFARRFHARGLTVVSALAAVLAAAAFVLDGPRWQTLPWQLLGLLVGSAAALRRARTKPVPRAARFVAVAFAVAVVLTGALFAMLVPVPTLPAPTGAHLVGSEVFRWTDAARPEAFTADPTDAREVIVQAWYPAHAASATPVPYFEAEGRLPGSVLGFPAWYYQEFEQVRVPATESPAVSSSRAEYPVIVFDPGLNNARESYTSLALDLASHGFVVAVVTHPHEAGVAVLSDGRVVGHTVSLFDASVSSAELLATREADVRFALDRLAALPGEDASSPLAGRLDLGRVALMGHSLGGATATQVLANDSRFAAGVNLDGTLFHAQPTLRLRQPFMWVQADGMHLESYDRARDGLAGNLQGGGVIVRIAGSAHNAFTDGPSYLTPTGRSLLGGLTGTGALTPEEMMAAASRLIRTFLAGALGDGPAANVEELAALHPAIQVERLVLPKGG